MPNERELLPGRTRCEKTGAPARAVFSTAVMWKFATSGQCSASATSSWKWVANSTIGAVRFALEQILADRLRDRKPVDRAGAAPDLVDQQQAALRRAAQDVRRLGHLDVEGRLSRGQVVARADAREDAVDDAERRRLGGHERADLREDHDQRGLAQVGRLAAHVRPGQQDEARAAPRSGAGRWARRPARAALPSPDGARRRSRTRSRRRNAAARSRARPRSARARRSDVELGHRPGGAQQVVDALGQALDEVLEERVLEP